MSRPRYRDYLQTLWCLAFDWTEGLHPLYRHDRHGPLVWLGERSQVIWFRAHNCRVYRWLDWRPDDDDKMTESEFDSAFAKGEPVEVVVALSHHWECPAEHLRISSSTPLPGGQCFCGEVMAVSAVTS